MKKDPISFAPGDIVQLKSLGPAMTVVSLTDEGVNAIWYDEVDGDLKTRFIPFVALVKIVLDDVEDEEEDEDEEDDEEDEWREEEARKARGRKKKTRD